MVKERVEKLRAVMKRENIACYIIPTSDSHNSEYVSEYFMARKYFSGFTGSAGILVIFADKASLFTDGRYFIQAEKQLEGSGIELMKIGEPGVPELKDYLEQELQEGENIGFDGRVVTAGDGLDYEKIADKKNGKVIWNLDLAAEVWTERPPLHFTPVFVLLEEYSGESTEDKLKRLRDKMKEEGATAHLLTTLDDIAWLFNLRADDVESCPVLLSYAVITDQEALLFAGESAFDGKVMQYLEDNNITLKPYDDFYTYVADMVKKQQKSRLLVNEKRINYRLKKEMGDVEIIDKPNPTSLMKAIKNPVEQENLKKAHLMDGIAVTRFMYWLKTNVGKLPMTEVSVSDYLESLRAENVSFIGPSFSTICAYGPNAAIVHYDADPESCAKIQAKGMLMVDSGGHYYEGSTDITRTFILGEITNEMKQHFTLVVRAMLRLKSTKFLHGCTGVSLDLAARQVFWEKGLDYKHGTGHGVGYLLNIHEGPNGFRYKILPGSDNTWVFEEGMVTTDEPGIYIEGSHGIRIENELLCHKDEKNEYGQFMCFEDLTYVPVDLDGIDMDVMEEKEKKALNEYHRMVFEKLSPYFEGEELAWLKNVTREI